MTRLAALLFLAGSLLGGCLNSQVGAQLKPAEPPPAILEATEEDRLQLRLVLTQMDLMRTKNENTTLWLNELQRQLFVVCQKLPEEKACKPLE